jgi:hypothetical protein
MIPLLTKDFTLPADGFYHIAPEGEFLHQPTGILQVLDKAACEAIAADFTARAASPEFAGVLIDYDHFSMDPDRPSEAAGWIMELQHRAGTGLWGRIRWTDNGEKAVTGGRYRYLSPVWMPQDCEQLAPHKLRPLRLKNAALTNAPNITGAVPLSNDARIAAPQPIVAFLANRELGALKNALTPGNEKQRRAFWARLRGSPAGSKQPPETSGDPATTPTPPSNAISVPGRTVLPPKGDNGAYPMPIVGPRPGVPSPGKPGDMWTGGSERFDERLGRNLTDEELALKRAGRLPKPGSGRTLYQEPKSAADLDAEAQAQAEELTRRLGLAKIIARRKAIEADQTRNKPALAGDAEARRQAAGVGVAKPAGPKQQPNPQATAKGTQIARVAVPVSRLRASTDALTAGRGLQWRGPVAQTAAGRRAEELKRGRPIGDWLAGLFQNRKLHAHEYQRRALFSALQHGRRLARRPYAGHSRLPAPDSRPISGLPLSAPLLNRGPMSDDERRAMFAKMHSRGPSAPPSALGPLPSEALAKEGRTSDFVPSPAAPVLVRNSPARLAELHGQRTALEAAAPQRPEPKAPDLTTIDPREARQAAMAAGGTATGILDAERKANEQNARVRAWHEETRRALAARGVSEKSMDAAVQREIDKAAAEDAKALADYEKDVERHGKALAQIDTKIAAEKIAADEAETRHWNETQALDAREQTAAAKARSAAEAKAAADAARAEREAQKAAEAAKPKDPVAQVSAIKRQRTAYRDALLLGALDAADRIAPGADHQANLAAIRAIAPNLGKPMSPRDRTAVAEFLRVLAQTDPHAYPRP